MREGEYIERVLHCRVIHVHFFSWDVGDFVSLGLPFFFFFTGLSLFHLISRVTDCQSSAESRQSGF